MEVATSIQGNKAVMELRGKFTVRALSELEKAVEGIPDQVCDFDIEMSQVDYVSSAGLRMLVSTSKAALRRGGILRVLHPQESVMDVLDITGIGGVLVIER